MDSTRTYIRTTDEAHSAVAEIVGLVTRGTVQPKVAFDFETMPIAGLEDYPRRKEDPATGKRMMPKKAEWLAYVQMRWAESFDPKALADLGLFIPRKLTNGNESKGISAKTAWASFHDAVLALWQDEPKHAWLEAARWQGRDDLMLSSELDQDEARLEALIVEYEAAPRGKKQLKENAKKELERIQWMKQRVPFVRERIEQPVDLRLLVHMVLVAVEGRGKHDPVQPGLDPYTSEVRTTQFTLKRWADGHLLTWVFNNAELPLELLRPVFELEENSGGDKVLWVGHNAKFDLKLALHYFGFAPENVFCTQVGSRMLYLGLKFVKHNLAACAKRFLKVTMDKMVREEFIGKRGIELTQEMIDYGALDTEILFPLYDAEMKMAKSRGQEELLTNFARLSHLVARWELRGWNLSVEKWLEIAAQVIARRDALARELEDMLLPAGYREALAAVVQGDEDEDDEEVEDEADSDDGDGPGKDTRKNAVIKLSQGKLVAERLSALIGMEVLSMAKGNLAILSSEYLRQIGRPHPFFELYEKWSKLNKQANTYGKRFLWYVHPITGRVHASFHIAGTDTSRFSSTAPNFLNLPTPKGADDVDFRAAILALAGFRFGNADYSAMEQRIAADVTGDPTLIALFEHDGDSHSVTAALMFHIKRADVKAPRVGPKAEFKSGTETKQIATVEVPRHWTPGDLMKFVCTDTSLFTVTGKDGAEKQVTLSDYIETTYKKSTRQTAKTVGFLFYFGGSAYGLAKKQNIPVEQAEDFFADYGGVYPVLVEEFNGFGELPFQNFVETPSGELFGYVEAYGGLRRWFRLPSNPSRYEYGNDWQGEGEFNRAQRQYRKDCNSIKREAKNVKTQAGNAVIMTEALLLLDQLGKPWGIEPALAIYDEILALVPEDVPERQANKIIEKAMMVPSKRYIKKVPSKAEANPLSPVWAKF